jgi:hypothetical protein
LRILLLALAAILSTTLLVPASTASAQWLPPGPPGPRPFPGVAPMAAPAMADPHAACQQALANAAYPIANQMVQFTAAANVYPTGPFGRPFVGPTIGYPGVNSLFLGPGGNLGAANALIASGRANLGALPAGAFPGAVINQLAGVPGGLVAVGCLGTGISADLLGIAGLTQGEVGNLLAAIDTRQGVLGTRFAAAELNAALTAFPREQAALLKEVLEGLTIYRDLACTPPSNGNGNGNGHHEEHENGNGNGQRP